METIPAGLVPAPILTLTTGVVRVEGFIVGVLAVHLFFFSFTPKLIVPALLVVFDHKDEQGLISRGNEWFVGVFLGCIRRKRPIILVVLPSILSRNLANALVYHPVKSRPVLVHLFVEGLFRLLLLGCARHPLVSKSVASQNV